MARPGTSDDNANKNKLKIEDDDVPKNNLNVEDFENNKQDESNEGQSPEKQIKILKGD